MKHTPKNTLFTILSIVTVIISTSVNADEVNIVKTLRGKYDLEKNRIESSTFEKYTNALVNLMHDYKTKGDMDAYLVLQKEQQTFSYPMIPDNQAQQASTEKVSGYQKLIQIIESERNQRMTLLQKQYIVRLDMLMKELTATDKIEDAQLVKNEIDLISQLIPKAKPIENKGDVLITEKQGKDRPVVNDPNLKPEIQNQKVRRLIEHWKTVLDSKPRRIQGRIEHDLKVEGLCIFDKDCVIQGGVKVIPTAGSIAINLGRISYTPTSIVGLPFLSIDKGGSCHTYSGPDQNTKCFQNTIFYGPVDICSTPQFKDCVFIRPHENSRNNLREIQGYTSSGGNPGKYVDCGFAGYKLSKMGTFLLRSSERCAFLSCTVQWLIVDKESVISFFDLDSQLAPSIANALYNSTKRFKVNTLKGKPANDYVAGMPQLVEFLDKIWTDLPE
ncbi:MAG: hypothetical protein WCS52_04975 [bacterium]